jgi:hypothetical protein
MLFFIAYLYIPTSSMPARENMSYLVWQNFKEHNDDVTNHIHPNNQYICVLCQEHDHPLTDESCSQQNLTNIQIYAIRHKTPWEMKVRLKKLTETSINKMGKLQEWCRLFEYETDYYLHINVISTNCSLTHPLLLPSVYRIATSLAPLHTCFFCHAAKLCTFDLPFWQSL